MFGNYADDNSTFDDASSTTLLASTVYRLALLGNVEKLKASCLYGEAPKVAFRLAFQAVCKIKAEVQGSKAFTREFADAMSISASEVRVRTQANTIHEDA